MSNGPEDPGEGERSVEPEAEEHAEAVEDSLPAPDELVLPLDDEPTYFEYSEPPGDAPGETDMGGEDLPPDNVIQLPFIGQNEGEEEAPPWLVNLMGRIQQNIGDLADEDGRILLQAGEDEAEKAVALLKGLGRAVVDQAADWIRERMQESSGEEEDVAEEQAPVSSGASEEAGEGQSTDKPAGLLDLLAGLLGGTEQKKPMKIRISPTIDIKLERDEPDGE